LRKRRAKFENKTVRGEKIKCRGVYIKDNWKMKKIPCRRL